MLIKWKAENVMSDTVYIKMDRSVEVTHEKVTIGDIAKIESKNKNIVNNIKPDVYKRQMF